MKTNDDYGVVAKLNHVRISPRKVKIVLDLIRGKNVRVAMAILENLRKAACESLIKLLKSAIANAQNNFNLNPSSLIVSCCYVTEGPTLKRVRFVSKGRSHRILKRTSHIFMKVEEKE